MMRNPMKISVSCVFDVGPNRLSFEAGRDLFTKALPRTAPNRTPQDIQREIEDKATGWAKQMDFPVMDHTPVGLRLSLQILWHDPESLYPISIRLAPGHRLAGFHVSQGFIDPKTVRTQHLEEYITRMLRISDTLQPTWGFADAFDRMGFGQKRDPRESGHWLCFLGNDAAATREFFCPPEPYEIRERPWGGKLVRAWRSPFEPPASGGSFSDR